jgi:hypothetical protein
VIEDGFITHTLESMRGEALLGKWETGLQENEVCRSSQFDQVQHSTDMGIGSGGKGIVVSVLEIDVSFGIGHVN